MLERRMRANEFESSILRMIEELRQDHPTMCCRNMYYKLKPEGIGRDKFEALCRSFGLMSYPKRSPRRTTDSSGVIRFDNLLETMLVSGINKAFCSDITYYEVNGQFYYITFIMDCYSRRILGHSVSKRLTTQETTLPALRMAVDQRGGMLDNGIVFHSDGGGQYYAKEFLTYTQLLGLRNSMCEMAYQNGKAERINRTIKHNYLYHYQIKSFQDLQKGVDRAVKLYNTDKPHSALNRLAPLDFEKQLLLLRQQTEPKMTESLEANPDFWGVEPQKSEQTEPQNPDVL